MATCALWYEKWFHPQWLHDTTTTSYGHELFWILLTKTSGGEHFITYYTSPKKETLRGGHFMTYYTSSKHYGRTRMHDNIVPWALRALGTKMKAKNFSGSHLTRTKKAAGPKEGSMRNHPAWIVKWKFKDFRASWRYVFNIFLIYGLHSSYQYITNWVLKQ